MHTMFLVERISDVKRGLPFIHGMTFHIGVSDNKCAYESTAKPFRVNLRFTELLICTSSKACNEQTRASPKKTSCQLEPHKSLTAQQLVATMKSKLPIGLRKRQKKTRQKVHLELIKFVRMF
uniref:ZP domain-containing protein n=1 Tax=Trichuris muris TaxID=70415 RepID=A0A5S6Q219_TRIMR